MDIDLTTTIAEVTVYPDRALVVRRGVATIAAAGEHTLRIGGLPTSLQPDSLRATGSGPAGTRILGIEQTPEYHAAAPEETLSRLRDEVQRLQQEVSLLGERQSILEEQQGWLKSLGQQSARSLAWGMARGTAKPEDASGFFAYTGEESQRLATARLEVDRQRDELSRELAARQREYDQLGGGRRPDRTAASVRVTLPGAGEMSVELSYLAYGAGWRPRYDARVDAEGARVRLTQQALVSQHTGEEWADVALALSTARPSAAVRLPDEPDPWYLDVVRPPAPPQPMPRMHTMMSAPMAASGALSAASDTLTNQEFAAFAKAAPAEMATAEVERSGAAQVFRLPGRGGVPSDGSPHTFGIGEYDLPCQLDYLAEPVVADGAHLRALATNASGRVLLPGELHVFHPGAAGDEYVGATRLELTAEGAELPLYLGVDDNVTVKRELVERDTEKGNLLQQGIRRVTLGYRVTLGNRTAAPQRVVLKDRLPVPQHERIKVKVLDIRPQPSARTRLEQLTWECQLAPGEERRVEWRFVVEAPADLELAGLP